MKLRSYLVLLVLATVLPVVLFAGLMTYRSYEQQRENLEQGMIERARAISAALDREFLVSIQSLKVLGASTHLDKGQLSEFYGDMKAALDGYSRAWQNLTLTDLTGQQLINLRRPFGSPLPTSGNPAAIHRALESRDAVIADLSPGPVTGALGIVVHVPVIRIIGFSQLMHDDKVDGPVSPAQKEYLGDILTSAAHLLQLIDDVLDLSKVESGRMEVQNSTFGIDEIIVEVAQTIAPMISTKELSLTREVPADLGPVTTDRRKLLQILLNLASNAAKFTDRGEIRICCEIVSSTLRIDVSDTGIGIRPADLSLLFQPFSQVDDSLRKRHIGTGLGLYLSRRLAHLLGGEITVESEYGKGSTFRVEIPIHL